MAARKKTAKTDAPKADVPKVEEAKPAKSPVITTDSVKENVYRVDMGESIP